MNSVFERLSLAGSLMLGHGLVGGSIEGRKSQEGGKVEHSPLFLLGFSGSALLRHGAR